MSLTEPESAALAEEEESNGERESVPSPLRDQEDKIVSEMYNVNNELVAYTFRLLEQCITLSDAMAEINQVNLLIIRQHIISL